MGMTKTHWMLCAGEDYAAAQTAVVAFFRKSILLDYDAVEVVEASSWSAENERFWEEVEKGEGANRLLLQGFLDDLRAEGCKDFSDLPSLPVGYPSKLLHIIAHLVDGFIGIDSVLYNMVEDSHWLSDGVRADIRKKPSRYWLLRVEASFVSEATAAFIHLHQK